MFKKLRKNEKGFTLAELLIVVAIIGVLVAISIPIFTSQLEKAREATDMANVRSAYAEVVASYLSDNKGKSIDVPITSNTSDWKSDSTAKLNGHAYKEMINSASDGTIKVAVDTDGKVTIGGTTIEDGETTTSGT